MVRAREDCRGDLMATRHRLSKLLLRHGIVYYGGEAWSKKHELWLRTHRFDTLGLQLAYDAAFDAMLATVDRRDRLDKAIAEMAANSAFTPVVTRLGCVRGVSTLTAFGLATEIGDWNRLTGRFDRRLPGVGTHRVLIGFDPLSGWDYQDRQQSRPSTVDRSGLASPSAVSTRETSAAPLGDSVAGGTGARAGS